MLDSDQTLDAYADLNQHWSHMFVKVVFKFGESQIQADLSQLFANDKL